MPVSWRNLNVLCCQGSNYGSLNVRQWLPLCYSIRLNNNAIVIIIIFMINISILIMFTIFITIIMIYIEDLKYHHHNNNNIHNCHKDNNDNKNSNNDNHHYLCQNHYITMIIMIKIMMTIIIIIRMIMLEIFTASCKFITISCTRECRTIFFFLFKHTFFLCFLPFWQNQRHCLTPKIFARIMDF